MDARVCCGDGDGGVQGRVRADAHDIQIFAREHLLVVKVSVRHLELVCASIERIAIDIAQRSEVDILQICVSGGVAPADPTTPDDART